MLQHYKHRARLRGLEWQLTREEFRELVQAPCAYCGAEPEPRFFPRYSHRLGHSERTESRESVNGVDRIDSRLGYTKANCASACWRCNRIKGSMSFEELKAHIAKILKRAGEV